MANRFLNKKNYTFEEYIAKSFKLNNGWTDVFLQELAITASEQAQYDYEVDLAIWIASQDQQMKGRGGVGFDIQQMPWSKTNFEKEKEFILNVIEVTKAKVPLKNEDTTWQQIFLGALSNFRELVEDFTIEYIDTHNYKKWQTEKPNSEKCIIHGVYRHWYGCIICEDTPQPEHAEIESVSLPTAETIKVPKELEDKIRALLTRGEKVEAIKLARQLTSLDLKETGKYVNSLETRAE